MNALKYKLRHQTRFQDKIEYILLNNNKTKNTNKDPRSVVDTKDSFNLDLYTYRYQGIFYKVNSWS